MPLGHIVCGADCLRGRLSRGRLSPGHIVSGVDCTVLYPPPPQWRETQFNLNSFKEQAGAELCQAQVKLEVVVEVGVEFGVELETCHN